MKPPRRPARRRDRRREPRRRSDRSRASALDAERVVGALASSGRKGTTAMRLLRRLGARPSELRSLRGLLRRLESDGRVERVSGGWRTPRADGLVEGELLAAGSDRGARVRDDTGREHRIEDPGEARPGDRVLVAPLGGGRAEVLEVVAGERDHWVGVLRGHGKLLGIAPYRDDGEWWVRVARADAGGAQPGEVVVAVPAARGPARRSQADASPWARVVERLGRPGDPDADFAAIVWRHRLPVAFPPEALGQAEALREPRARELDDRVDLRHLPFVTVDPATARDHDDAVCVEIGRGFRLWVAIADVAHWVEPGSPIDREAFRRGNSVYFADRAIPMLPERLSGDICSLRPGEDRLAMVVEIPFDESGEAGRPRFHAAVITSRARLTYEDAQAAIDQGGHARRRSDDPVPEAAMLADLAHLTRLLRERRIAAGSLDLDLPSPAFVFDERGHPVDVRPVPRNESHRMIEDAMLAANRAVAEWLVEREVEAVHRIHEPPAPPDTARLVTELTALGLLAGGDPEALTVRELSRALARASGRPGERWLHQLVLRSMRRARYSARSVPHYALGFEHYLHFTSPIRRYADLAVHRALKAALAGEPPALDLRRAEAIAVRTSYRERVAMDAEREMDQLKACVLLRDHVGERHEGTVTGLARHGLYVTLDAWWVEGLVHVSRLPDYFELDESGRALVAPSARYELGDRVGVAIAAADPVTARIDFELETPRPRRRSRGSE